MDSWENDHKYINEIWRRINIKEYDKIQLQKIKENKKTLKRIRIRWMTSTFGISSAVSLTLYFKFGMGMKLILMSTLIFLVSSQLYEYFSFKEIKRRIYRENRGY